MIYLTNIYQIEKFLKTFEVSKTILAEMVSVLNTGFSIICKSIRRYLYFFYFHESHLCDNLFLQVY